MGQVAAGRPWHSASLHCQVLLDPATAHALTLACIAMTNGQTWIYLLTILILAVLHDIQAQDSLAHFRKNFKETVLTFGYNYNFGDKVEGKRPKPYHFIELGVWRTNASVAGHHPFSATYYFANDFGLNTTDLVIGPKIGGFVSIMIMGLGGEFCYYTDFESGSLRFIPSIGLFTPYFKLTINPHVIITNKDFQNLNNGHANLTIRLYKIKRIEF